MPQTSGNDDASAADFRSDALLVEVYATVTDNRGRYVDDFDLDGCERLLVRCPNEKQIEQYRRDAAACACGGPRLRSRIDGYRENFRI